MKHLKLTKGLSTKVDDADYDYLVLRKYYALKARNNRYAARDIIVNGRKRTISLHRELVDAPAGMYVDHINGDTLDNRRENLRLCTNAQNCANQRKRKNCHSRYKGVSWDKYSSTWVAYIRVNYKQIHLGRYDDEVEAAKAYNEAAKKHFGPFARLNDL